MWNKLNINQKMKVEGARDAYSSKDVEKYACKDNSQFEEELQFSQVADLKADLLKQV